MGILKRIFGIGKAEANAAIDKLEDPVKMTEQGIKELKIALQETNESTIKVKAQELKEQTRADKFKREATEWKEKAKKLLTKGEEELAITALNNQENLLKEAGFAQKSADGIQITVDKLSDKSKQIQEAISTAIKDLNSLRARQTASDALNKANKEMDSNNVGSTMDMLKKMKAKVEDTEAINEAHDVLKDSGKTDEDRINELLAEESKTDNNDLLASLKAEMSEEK